MTTTPPPNPQPVPGVAILAALLLAAVAIAGVVIFDRKHELFATKKSTPASQAASAPSDPPPEHMDKDGQFLWSLSSQGLQLRRSNDAAINDARRICVRYVSGESEQQIIQDVLRGSPGMSLDTASTFTDTAISVYCPEGYLNSP